MKTRLLCFLALASGCFNEQEFLARCTRCASEPDAGVAHGRWGSASRLFTNLPIASASFTLERRRNLFAGADEGCASAVLTREGTLVGVPLRRTTFGAARVLVMEADGGLTEGSLVDRVGMDSWRAAVLADDGFVYAMPASDEQVLRLDSRGRAERVGPVLPRPSKFKGALLLSDGRIFAVPDGETQPMIFDPRDAGITQLEVLSENPVRGTGGTLLSDGRVVFAGAGSSALKSTIYTFDGNAFTKTEVDGVYGRGVTLPDGGALLLPRLGNFLRAFPGESSLPIEQLGGALDRDPRVNTMAWSTQGFAYGISGYVDVGVVTVGPAGARAREQDAGTWLFGAFDHLVGTPDGRLVSFPNDPNDDVLVLFPNNRRAVPVEVVASPFFNHY